MGKKLTDIKIDSLLIVYNESGFITIDRGILKRAAKISEIKILNPVDYTEWRQGLFEGLSGREISKAAMQFIKSEGKEN
jgi:hypothetical protein